MAGKVNNLLKYTFMKTHEKSNSHQCLKIICEVAKFALIGVATTLGFKALKEAEKAKRYVEEHRR